MGVEAATLMAERIEKLVKTASAGFVCWDAAPPRNESYSQHKHTILDAFNTGFAFCRTDTRSEWLVLGQAALQVVRNLPAFERRAPVPCHPFVYIGKLNGADVYVVSRNSESFQIKDAEYFMGLDDRAAKGAIINCLAFPGDKIDDNNEDDPPYDELPNDDEG